MPIDFPSNPSSGQTYSYAGQQWQFNGVAWDKTTGSGSGPTGPTGPQGNTGATGAQGEPGQSSNYYSYKVHTTTQTPPTGNGEIRYNNATQTSSTVLYVDHLDNNGDDIDIFLSLLKQNDNLIIQDASNSNNYQTWRINSAPTVILNDYTSIPVTGITSAGTGTSGFANNHQVLFIVFSSPIATAYVESLRGLTGAIGLTNGSGIGLSVSGNTLTVSNTGVLSVNGSTGAITNVARTNVDNNFSAPQTINALGAVFGIYDTLNSAGVTIDPLSNDIIWTNGLNQSTLDFNPQGQVVTLPNITTTLAGLSGTQTFGGTKTFNALTTFNAGISSAGGTFSALTRFTAGISASGGITFNSNVTVNSANTLNVSSIVSDGQVSIEDTSNAIVSIGDHSYNANSTYIFLRDTSTILELSNPFGTIDIGDPNGIDSGNYISYSATNSTLYGNSNSLNGFSDLSANYIYALSGISASGGVTLSGPLNIRNTLLINGSQGSNNQVLTSTGIGITWAAVPAGFSRSINTITSSTTAGSTANIDYVYNGNTSGNINLTLPTAVSNTNRYTVKNSNIGILTVLTTSSQTIDGITGYALSKQYQAIDLLSDNSNWFIV